MAQRCSDRVVSSATELVSSLVSSHRLPRSIACSLVLHFLSVIIVYSFYISHTVVIFPIFHPANNSTQSSKETLIIMATQQPAQAFASHLINQTLSSIALLESLSLINSADASLIRQKLPSPTGPFPSLSPPSPSNSFANLTIAQSSPTSSWTVQHARDDNSSNSPSNSMQPSASAPALPPRQRSEPAERRAKALWDFSGTVRFQHAFRIHTHCPYEH